MRQRYFIRRLAALTLCLCLFASTLSCGAVSGLIDKGGSDPDSGPATAREPRPTGEIAVGPTKFVASSVVDASGGTISVRDPSNPLNGLELDVPPGAYSNVHQVNISYAPVLAHSFGQYFNPATPLITIDDGGGLSDEFITLRIPVEVPTDHFAMAFYYDDTTGTLEGLTFSGLEADGITVFTRHFSSLLVSIVKNSLLDDLMKGDVDSHFRPGIDDWQFPNYGSYIAPEGHCAGQCLTALWYYCEQPDGKDLTLHGRYDRNGVRPATPGLWDDDSRGYRLASVVHEDIDWDSFANQFMFHMTDVRDELKYKAFVYAIQLTGEPQEVGIFASGGGGHDMICYRVHQQSLYIADPNYPGRTDRRIEFADGKFKPYESGDNADAIAAGYSQKYEIIQYCGKTATVDWKGIARRWDEFKQGTIGDAQFPQYEVVVIDDEGHTAPLSDGYESEHKKLRINVKGDIPLGMKVFRDGALLQRDAAGKYELQDGNNLIGISVWGRTRNNPHGWEYIDFVYLNIQYGEPEYHGWVLESVTIEWEPEEHKHAEEYYRDYMYDITDGSFTSSGVQYQGQETGLPWFPKGEGIWIRFVHTGSWTPFPRYIPAGKTEPVTFTLSCMQHELLSRLPDSVSHSYNTLCGVSLMASAGPYYYDVYVISFPGYDVYRLTCDSDEGSSDSVTVELDPDGLMADMKEGSPREGSGMRFTVWCGDGNALGQAIYDYVYHE